jgi:hypothetical protein
MLPKNWRATKQKNDHPSNNLEYNAFMAPILLALQVNDYNHTHNIRAKAFTLQLFSTRFEPCKTTIFLIKSYSKVLA